MTKQHKKDPIPEDVSREELAKFWDTHDFTDYIDEFKPVKARFAKNLSEGLSIRLDKETLEKLRQQAHEKGIGPATLVRMWIIEHMRGAASPNQEHGRPSNPA